MYFKKSNRFLLNDSSYKLIEHFQYKSSNPVEKKQDRKKDQSKDIKSLLIKYFVKKKKKKRTDEKQEQPTDRQSLPIKSFVGNYDKDFNRF